MLRRQQAEAVIAARRKLVEGAVGMVEMALIDINEKSLATFTSAQKVALVTNLMTVLVGDTQTQPVLQMGTVERVSTRSAGRHLCWTGATDPFTGAGLGNKTGGPRSDRPLS